MIRVDQAAYHRAMRDQGRVKPEFFPVGNRAARRQAQKEARTEARAMAGTITPPDAAALAGGAASQQGVPNADAGPRFVTIEYFWRDMLGFKSKQWFYMHKDDPGMPQRVYVGSRDPMLVYDECVAYMHQLMAARTKPKPKRQRKRHTGRPAGPARRS